MPANLAAQAFWRRVIAELTVSAFTQVQVAQGSWQGVVQQFHIRAAAYTSIERPSQWPLRAL